MTPTRKRRLMIIAAFVMLAAAGIALLVYALQSNLNYLYSPSEVRAGQIAEGANFRLGGVVLEDSVLRSEGSLLVQFAVTDRVHNFPVRFEGILPDMFQQGTSVISHGRIENGCFVAVKVLAKHDETYMPEEVAKAIAEAGAAGDAQPAMSAAEVSALLAPCN